jgi:hypothetical protein
LLGAEGRTRILLSGEQQFRKLACPLNIATAGVVYQQKALQPLEEDHNLLGGHV